MRRIGGEAAGWLSAGRPRREAFRVALRACARRGAAELADGARRLRRARSPLHARELRDALAADYTYLQAAQPTTAGHLLLAYAYPALRDAERLRHAHRELSRSVAGAGGSAGSRWPLDRAALAELLGCDGLVAAYEGRRLAVGRLRRAALDARDRRHAPLAAGPGLRDLREPRVRPDRAGRRALARERADAAEAQSLRARRHPRAGRARRRATSPPRSPSRTRARRAPTTSTSSTASCRARSRRPARSGGSTAAVLAGLRVDAERMARVAREGFTNAADVADVLAAGGGSGLPHGAQGRRPGRPAAARGRRGGSSPPRPSPPPRSSSRAGPSPSTRPSSTRPPARRRGCRKAPPRARRWTRCWPRSTRPAHASAPGRPRRWPPPRPPSGRCSSARRVLRGGERGGPTVALVLVL